MFSYSIVNVVWFGGAFVNIGNTCTCIGGFNVVNTGAAFAYPHPPYTSLFIGRAGACLTVGQALLVVLHLGDVIAGIGNQFRCIFHAGMDVDVGAGRGSTWRRAPAAAADGDDGEDARGGSVGGGMEAQVVPVELYDSARAKIDANLRWLFAKAYGTGKAVCLCVCLRVLFQLHIWTHIIYLPGFLIYLFVKLLAIVILLLVNLVDLHCNFLLRSSFRLIMQAESSTQCILPVYVSLHWNA